MPRTRMLGLVIALMSSLLLASAAAASSSPRGVLTAAEYHELLAEQKALNGSNFLHERASTICRSLTGISQLTATQHSECVAEVPFWDDFTAFDTALNRCEKAGADVAALRCMYGVLDGFYNATAAYVRANTAATSVANARKITGKCFDYLVFTAPQVRAMNQLAAGLHTFTLDVATLNAAALRAEQSVIGSDIADAEKAMNVPGTVKVCPHEKAQATLEA